MKKIVLDLRYITDRRTGVGIYSQKIFEGLIAKKDKKNFYKGISFLENSKSMYFRQNKNIIKLPLLYYKDGNILGKRNKIFWSIFSKLNSLTNFIEIWHCFHYSVPPKNSSMKIVVTIHDLIPYVVDCYSSYDKEKYLEIIRKNVTRADIIITVSEFSKADIIKYLNVNSERIKIISPGIDLDEYNKKYNLDEIRKKYGIEKKFILFIGALEPKKNIISIIKAFEKVRDNSDIELVIAGGKAWEYDEIFKQYECSKYKKNIKMLGYIEEGDKIALYKATELFIFPSFYEGFGMPVLEAMAAGTPVITSNVSSLPEVSGGAALLVDPYNIDEISEAINKVLKDTELRKNMIVTGLEQAKKYTWKNSVDKLLKIYEEL